jgi:F-type H+-transporting ATPase subunit a
MPLKFSQILRLCFVFTISIAAAGLKLSAQDHTGHDHGEEQQATQTDSLGYEVPAKKFNAGEMIMHHIADAHEIHIVGDFAIYLPVIVKGADGFDVFSSSHFYHNENHGHHIKPDGTEYHYHYGRHGNYILYHEHIYLVNKNGGIAFDSETGEISNTPVLDLSLTKSVAGFLITSLIIIAIFLSVAKAYTKRRNEAPKGLQSFIPSIGKHRAEKFMPFLLTVFFFIWVANLLGLIPFIGGFNVTGTLSVTMVLALLVFIITTINGNKHYWGHIFWPPGVPLPIKLILVPIEAASIFIKPLVLMIRLTANITAGHIIILSFVSLIIIFWEQSGAGVGIGVGIGSTLFMIFLYFIKLLVCFLQAYVFTLLAALYFGDATQEAHH